MDERRNIEKLGVVTLGVNIALMAVKIIAGVLGNCYALIADGVESAGDVFTSIVTWGGYHLSLQPADKAHPFGHGKIESIAGMFSGVSLFVAATVIVVQALSEIRSDSGVPQVWTLPLLLGVVLVKEILSRKVLRSNESVRSVALEGDAWHHRSDAITSGVAAVGIALALFGGEAFAEADDYAALLACSIIYFNGYRIGKQAVHELMDGEVTSGPREGILRVALSFADVKAVETCRLRKSGTDYFVELHVCVPAQMTVGEGHQLGHRVKNAVRAAYPVVADVVVHLEPWHVSEGEDHV